MTRKRRSRPRPTDEVKVPAWQVGLFGTTALALGVGAMIFGVADLRGWIRAMSMEAAVVTTGSTMFAIPALATAFLCLSVLAPLSRAGGAWRERLMTKAFGAFLALTGC